MSDSTSEKVAVAVIRGTPAPIVVGLWVILISLFLAFLAANLDKCTEFSSTHQWFDLVSLKSSCDLDGLSLSSLLTIAIFFGISLVITSLVTLVSYQIFTNSKDDALSGIRKKIRGKWNVEADSSDGAQWRGEATFEIEDYFRKLVLTIDAPARGNYARTIVNTYDISINPRENPMKVTYFVDGVFPLAEGGNIARLVVARLTWVFSGNKEYLRGSWHDLLPPSWSKRTTGVLEFSREKT